MHALYKHTDTLFPHCPLCSPRPAQLSQDDLTAVTAGAASVVPAGGSTRQQSSAGLAHRTSTAGGSASAAAVSAHGVELGGPDSRTAQHGDSYGRSCMPSFSLQAVHHECGAELQLHHLGLLG